MPHLPITTAIVLLLAVMPLSIPEGTHADHGSPHGTAVVTSGGGGQQSAGGGQQPGGGGQQSPGDYLSKLYIWFLGFVGIAALFAIVTGGVMYMLSGASIGSTQQAKKWILNGVWGIVLAAASVLLLRTINPDLVTGFDIQKVIDAAVKNQPKQQQQTPGVNVGVEG